MSFISNAFGGGNGWTVGSGNSDQQKWNQAANTNYGTANNELAQLISQLQVQAQGGGPNLANQQLQNATGQNIANQAALMSGQRGAATNPGLLARNIANQGAGIQQQAAGQAAQNALAQQLAAQQQIGSLAATQGSLANQNYGVTQGAVNNANQVGANIAGQNAQQNGGILGGISNGIGAIGGLISTGKSLLGGGSSPIQSAGSSYQNGNVFAAEGGELEKPNLRMGLSKSKIPEHLSKIASIRYPHMMSQGGESSDVKAMLSPGEKILKPRDVKKVEKGANPMKVGERVPGTPKHPGNDYRNDTVPKNLPQHSIVLPNSITNHPNAPALAYDFVSRIKAGHHRRR